MTKKVLVALVVAAAVTVSVGIASAASHQFQGERSKTALMPVQGSGVTGIVRLRATPEGETDIVVRARGLQPGARYASFYYDGHHCEVGPDLVGTFTADSSGHGRVHGTADDPIDDIASVSVRTPDYSVLFACAVF
jgi:hypothetical protein